MISFTSADLTPSWRHGSSAETKESNTESCLQNSSALISSDEYWKASLLQALNFGMVCLLKTQRSQSALNLETWPNSAATDSAYCVVTAWRYTARVQYGGDDWIQWVVTAWDFIWCQSASRRRTWIWDHYTHCYQSVSLSCWIIMIMMINFAGQKCSCVIHVSVDYMRCNITIEANQFSCWSFCNLSIMLCVLLFCQILLLVKAETKLTARWGREWSYVLSLIFFFIIS